MDTIKSEEKWLSQSKVNMIDRVNIKYGVIMVTISTYTSDLNDDIYIYIYWIIII